MVDNQIIPKRNKAMFYTTKSLKTKIRLINESLENIDDEINLNEIDYATLDEIIYRLEISALSCRYAIATSDYNNEEFNYNMNEIYSMNYPIDIEFKDKTLTIKTPVIFRNNRNYKMFIRNFMLADYVSLAMKKWCLENNFDLKNAIELPLVIIIQRNAYKWNRSKYCDNDNLEGGKIINEIIINQLGYSDSARNMTTITTYKKVDTIEEDCTKFIIFSKNDLINHLNEI